MSGPVGACPARLGHVWPGRGRNLPEISLRSDDPGRSRCARAIPLRLDILCAWTILLRGIPLCPWGCCAHGHHPGELVGTIPLHSWGVSAKNDLGTRT